jgi:hypothetical protein
MISSKTFFLSRGRRGDRRAEIEALQLLQLQFGILDVSGNGSISLG